MIKSIKIENAVRFSKEKGNAIAEVSEGWTNVRQVVHMQKPITKDVMEYLANELGLRYWAADPTPHDKAGEGFTDDAEKVSIAFPR